MTVEKAQLDKFKQAAGDLERDDDDQISKARLKSWSRNP